MPTVHYHQVYLAHYFKFGSSFQSSFTNAEYIAGL